MDAVLELLDEVLLVTPLTSLVDDFVSSQLPVIGDVEEVADFVEERCCVACPQSEFVA